MNPNTASAFSRPNIELAARLRDAMATYDRRRVATLGKPQPVEIDTSDLEAALANIVPAAIAAPARPIEVRNFGNGRRRAKAAYDAHFAQQGLAPRLDAADPISAKALVGYSPASLSLLASPATRAYAQALANISSLYISEPLKAVLREQARRQHEIANPAPRTKPKSRWFDDAHKAEPAKNARPVAYRYLCDEARVEWHQAAIVALGAAKPFTLNLRPDVEEMAIRQPSAASWLLKRFRHHLREELGRPVSIEFVLEQAEHGRLHLHGVVGISDAEALKARRAMRKAGGEFVDKKSRQFQAKTRGELDGGWAGYMAKDLLLARPRVREMMKGDRRERRFQGEAVAATQDVRRLAKEMYEAARIAFISPKKTSSKTIRRISKSKYQSNLIDASALRSSTYLSAPPNTLRQIRSTLIGEQPKCIPHSHTLKTPATPLWSPPSPASPPAPAARPSFATPASATIWSSSTPWTPPSPSLARSRAASTGTPSSSRSRTPPASCPPAWPWRSSRTKPATGAWSSRWPPSGPESAKRTRPEPTLDPLAITNSGPGIRHEGRHDRET